MLDTTLRRICATLTIGAVVAGSAVWVASASVSHKKTDDNAKNLSVVISLLANQATAKEAELAQIKKFCKLGLLPPDCEQCQLIE